MTVAGRVSSTAAEPLSDDQWSKVVEMEAKAQNEARERLSQLPIKSVQWGRTVSTGPYESARLSIEVDVATAGEAASTLTQAQEWVEANLPLSQHKVDQMYRDRDALIEEHAALDERLMEAKRKWDTIVTVFNRLGIDLPKAVAEDLPF